MFISPIVRQFIVAGSTLLAALSAGATVAYPNILLHQLQRNDSIIHIDLNNGSWIGSVHGIAGIPSIFLPFLMQNKGRKFAFILSSAFLIMGWLIISLAQDIITLIAGECFHGIGSNSLLTVSVLSITELVQPKSRNVCLLLYGTIQMLGVSLVGIFGRLMYWKTISLIMCCPILFAFIIGCVWPESPSWLACKGKFEECQRVFQKLRGTDDESLKELNDLVKSQKENNVVNPQSNVIKHFLKTIARRDFYIPAFHAFVLINMTYWSGGMPAIVYSMDMIFKLSGKINERVKLIMDCIYFPGYVITTILAKYYSNKKLIYVSLSGSAIFMTSAAAVSYLQSVKSISSDSELAVYCLVGFVVFFSLGCSGISTSIASEIIPVKHRGLGGSLLVIYTCVLHTIALKSYPYLCLHIKIWGVFLVYAAYMLFSMLFIWKYIPETRNRTLLEIEEFYNNGHFKENIIGHAVNEPFIKFEKKLPEKRLGVSWRLE